MMYASTADIATNRAMTVCLCMAGEDVSLADGDDKCKKRRRMKRMSPTVAESQETWRRVHSSRTQAHRAKHTQPAEEEKNYQPIFPPDGPRLAIFIRCTCERGISPAATRGGRGHGTKSRLPRVSQIFFSLLAFVCLFVLLRYLCFPPFQPALAKRILERRPKLELLADIH